MHYLLNHLDTAWSLTLFHLRLSLIPVLLGKTLDSATEVPSLLSATRGHPMARHALEAAVWDHARGPAAAVAEAAARSVGAIA